MGIIFILFQMHEGDDDQQIEYSWPYPHPSPTEHLIKSPQKLSIANLFTYLPYVMAWQKDDVFSKEDYSNLICKQLQ